MLVAVDRGVPKRQRTLVLCEPPFLFWDRSMDRLRQDEETIPGMGVLVLAALARRHGYRVHLVDAKQQGSSVEEVSRRIAALRPDYLGISATTVSVANGARIAAAARVYVRSKFAAGRYVIGRLPQRYRVTFNSGVER